MVYPRSALLLKRINQVLSTAICDGTVGLIASKGSKPSSSSSSSSSPLPPAAPLFATELLYNLPSDIVQKHLVRPLLLAVTNMVDDSSTTSLSWLSVLVDILFKLRDVRDNADMFEPSLSSTSLMKRKSGKYLKNNGRGGMPREDWGYESEELNNGNSSDDNDDSEKEDDEQEVDDEDSDDDDHIDDEDRDGQLHELLSSCGQELATITSACLDLIGSTSVPTKEATTTTTTTTLSSKRENNKGKRADNSNRAIASNINEGIAVPGKGTKEVDDLTFVVASACVQWLVVAYPTPLLAHADNRSKFNAALVQAISASSSSSSSPSSSSSSSSQRHRAAHSSRLLARVLRQDVLISLASDTKSDMRPSMVQCMQALPKVVKAAAIRVTACPQSIELIWGTLGLLELYANQLQQKSQGDEPSHQINDDDDDDDDENSREKCEKKVLLSILSVSERDALLQAVGTALQSPCHWLRVGLLSIMKYLPSPRLVTPKGTTASQDDEDDDGRVNPQSSSSSSSSSQQYRSIHGAGGDRMVDVAKLCLVTAGTPAGNMTYHDLIWHDMTYHTTT